MSAPEMEPIQTLAQRWLDLDQDESTRPEIMDLVQTGDVAALEDRLRHNIAFGTAGLRSSMKAGFAHMNSVTVILASQGLARYILTSLEGDKASGHAIKHQIVVGFDARHNSEKFARLAAAAFLAKGLSILWFGRIVHTPLVPFAVGFYKAAAGIMITASHNPKNDNGYKVYWSNGCQIIPPHDAGIAQAINTEQSIVSWDSTQVDHSPFVKQIYDEAFLAYFQSVRTLIPDSYRDSHGLEFLYTPLHGVGLRFVTEATRILRLDNSMNVVASQAEPDPEFPTLPFPNPEEKGALDLAKGEADGTNCSLILANDPDADRFAAVERLPNGTWHQFTGNQMGVLLASYMLEMHKGDRRKVAMLASTVSSRMLATMAAKEGFHFQETLTGFKWLGNVAQVLERQGHEAIYAYEEAIGYMFPRIVWDKDGVAALTVFLLACTAWKQRGLTPYSRLQQLYETYGYFEDVNTYLISPSPSTTSKVFNDVRVLNHGSRPETVGSRKILRWRDLTLGYDSGTKDGTPDLPVDVSAQMITCELENTVFTARGSGTEPKIKLYIESKGDTSREAKARAESVLSDLLKEWFKPEYRLKLAGT